MKKMNAAVVTSFAEPPRYREFDVPQPQSADQILVDVLAAGLHPRVRSGAAGTHYTSTGTLPMIPGLDAVGQRADGTRIYFVSDDDAAGTMAEQAVADVRRAVELPAGVDVAKVAAATNPAMSSVGGAAPPGPAGARPGCPRARRDRQRRHHGGPGGQAARCRPGSGCRARPGPARRADRGRGGRDRPADRRPGRHRQRARRRRGRGRHRPGLLVGRPARDAIVALLTARPNRSRALNWIQIGAVAGPTLELPSVALRSANLRVLGSGQGAVPHRRATGPNCPRSSRKSVPARSRSPRSRCRWPT